MERFKKFDDITKPDERNLHFIVHNRETGESHRLGLRDVYESVSKINLSKSVPEDIRSQFNVAKNLTIYSWFSYSFHEVAELKALSILEMALRFKLGKRKGGLKTLLDRAVARGLIKEKDSSRVRNGVQDEPSIELDRRLPDIMSYFRNILAHGSPLLQGGSTYTLILCADLINQLFKN